MNVCIVQVKLMSQGSKGAQAEQLVSSLATTADSVLTGMAVVCLIV